MPSGPAAPPGTGDRPARLVWTVGAIFLFVFPIVRWASVPAGNRLRVPMTPLDLSTPWSAAHWSFLVAARELVPRGAKFTVVDPDRVTEMNVYMMAIGVLPDRQPIPSSYFGGPRLDSTDADYVLAVNCRIVPEWTTLLARVMEGCVFRRAQRR